MVSVNSSKRDRGLKYYLLRGTVIILTGAFVDVFIQGIVPFTAFDVLYLTGFALPAVYLFRQSRLAVKYIAVLAILLITFVLQQTLEYRAFPDETELFGEAGNTSESLSGTGIIRAWLYDGWFPVFPWLSVALTGSIFACYRQSVKSLANIKAMIAGSILAAVGVSLLHICFSDVSTFDLLIKREPYGELFYPATVPFIIGATGVCLLFFCLVDRTRENNGWKPFIVFGKTSMFNYILHTGLVAYIICPYFENSLQPLNTGWIVYILLIVISLAASLGISLLKTKIKSKSLIIHLLLGQ
jgi:uncharacterized membrane protein YeiB